MVECLVLPAFTGMIFSQVEKSLELVADLLTVGTGKILLINFARDPHTLVLSTTLLTRLGPGYCMLVFLLGKICLPQQIT